MVPAFLAGWQDVSLDGYTFRGVPERDGAREGSLLFPAKPARLGQSPCISQLCGPKGCTARQIRLLQPSLYICAQINGGEGLAEEGGGARGVEPDSVRWDEMGTEMFREDAGCGGRSRRGAENRGAFGTWRRPIRVRGTGAGTRGSRPRPVVFGSRIDWRREAGDVRGCFGSRRERHLLADVRRVPARGICRLIKVVWRKLSRLASRFVNDVLYGTISRPTSAQSRGCGRLLQQDPRLRPRAVQSLGMSS